MRLLCLLILSRGLSCVYLMFTRLFSLGVFLGLSAVRKSVVSLTGTSFARLTLAEIRYRPEPRFLFE